MKIGIMVISGFSMLVKCRITVTDINEKNLNSGSGFCILFYNKTRNDGDRKSVIPRLGGNAE